MPGQGVGYEEFEATQTKRQHAVSRDLANPSHFDRFDCAQCYAWWVRAAPHLSPPRAWFFCVVELSLAIELVDGCAGSWDGREIRHCSAIPVGISDGDALLSLWRGAKADAQRAALRMEEMCDALRAREQSVYVRGMAWCIGQTVWVKWAPTGEQMAGKIWRRTTGEIKDVLADGSIRVFWPSDDADDVLCAKEVRERMVHAGVVGPRPQLAGLELVGRRIRVYWPYRCERGYGDDRVFAGLQADVFSSFFPSSFLSFS